MRLIFRTIPGLVVTIVFSIYAQAEVFKNSYVSFQLPPNWQCKLEGGEHVCSNKLIKHAKEAIIVLAAKEVGPTDNLMQFESYLKTPKSKRPGHKPKVYKVSRVTIGNHIWVDGLQFGSEVPNYFTRYLATVKDRLAILVTFSAHRKHYTKYSGDFIRAVKSLQVIAPKNILSGNPNNAFRKKGSIFGQAGAPFQDEFSGEDMPPEPTATSGNMMTKLMGLGLILLALAIYFLSKKKKKRRRN